MSANHVRCTTIVFALALAAAPRLPAQDVPVPPRAQFLVLPDPNEPTPPGQPPPPPRTHGVPSAPVDCSFLGLEHLTLGVFPPDTHGAVGRDFLMITLNDNIRIQARDGTNLFTQRLNAWWQTFDPTLIDVYDPRVLYDHEADRWIFTAAAQRLSAGACVLLAVSQTT